MSVFTNIRNWIEEPPPKFAFEFGPSGMAVWQESGGQSFEPMEGLDRNPDAQALEALLRKATLAPLGNRRRPAAVILPDSCARLSLLDFDSISRKPEEQMALIRFRLKRSVPFDVESASIQYTVDAKPGGGVNVIAAAIAIETLAPYEMAFRNAGFHPGFITLSSLSMANLAAPDTVLMRLTGSHFTLSYFDGTRLRLYRGLDLESAGFEEILNVIDPTLAYLEDELKKKPIRADVCGLAQLGHELTSHLSETWQLAMQPLRSRLATVEAHNAGLLGYLEAVGVS